MPRSKRRAGQPDDWWTVVSTPLIDKYKSFFDELGDPMLRSDFPYSEVSWRQRFEKASGVALWKVRGNHPRDSLSLDLIAAAERATSTNSTTSTGAAFGGGGASSNEIWIPMLDGGVYLEFTLVEDQLTNALTGYQTTIVGGSKCFRYLLRALRFLPINRRIADEVSMPRFEEIEKLLENQKQPGTEANEKLISMASASGRSWTSKF